jgi:enamine deaminase RidA (YjgF/YER057c/UK114 family)
MRIGVPSSPATQPLLCGIILFIVGAYPAQPQSDKSEKTIHIPSSGREVLIATTAEKASAYDQYHYSPARRVGNTLYISGVVVGRRDGEGKDIAAFKTQVRRAFQRIQATLNAAGANFDDVVMLNTFHV